MRQSFLACKSLPVVIPGNFKAFPAFGEGDVRRETCKGTIKKRYLRIIVDGGSYGMRNQKELAKIIGHRKAEVAAGLDYAAYAVEEPKEA